MKNLYLLIFSSLMFLLSCSRTTDVEKTDSTFAKGADISWLPQMEASGYTNRTD